MDRRDFLIGATTGVASMALAKAAVAGSHGAHHGHAAGTPAAAVDPLVRALRETTLDCQAAAADCVQHCLASLGAGDTSLAACMQSVLRMQAVTAALHTVAGSEATTSGRTRDLAGVCADFCRDCAAECEPHADEHAACKACLDACRDCIEACEAVAA